METIRELIGVGIIVYVLWALGAIWSELSDISGVLTNLHNMKGVTDGLSNVTTYLRRLDDTAKELRSDCSNCSASLHYLCSRK
jgi:hypothetical protein